jgi:hypothetical protein
VSSRVGVKSRHGDWGEADSLWGWGSPAHVEGKGVQDLGPEAFRGQESRGCQGSLG